MRKFLFEILFALFTCKFWGKIPGFIFFPRVLFSTRSTHFWKVSALSIQEICREFLPREPCAYPSVNGKDNRPASPVIICLFCPLDYLCTVYYPSISVKVKSRCCDWRQPLCKRERWTAVKERANEWARCPGLWENYLPYILTINYVIP